MDYDSGADIRYERAEGLLPSPDRYHSPWFHFEREEVLKGFDHYRPLLEDIRRLEEKLADASLHSSHEADLFDLHHNQELLLTGSYYRRECRD